jgi:hypothetical protein
MLPIFLLQEES